MISDSYNMSNVTVHVFGNFVTYKIWAHKKCSQILSKCYNLIKGNAVKYFMQSRESKKNH